MVQNLRAATAGEAEGGQPRRSDEVSDEVNVSDSPAPQRSIVADLLELDPTDARDDQIQEVVDAHVALSLSDSPLSQRFDVLVLSNESLLTRSSANRIYSALDGLNRTKPILLILNTPGGDIAAAYFVAKLCREHTQLEFEVAVPRRAKSAGTLICCGADRIHMGSLSELGPIDPQFGAIPALALKHSIEHIAELVGTYPAAREMFSEYLVRSLRIESLGFFERVAVSATQYAIRLLNARRPSTVPTATETIANRLVYAYKDHGFVIDAREAAEIFGDGVVAFNTSEYQFSNTVFDSLDFAGWICERHFGRDFSYIGSRQGCWVVKKQR